MGSVFKIWKTRAHNNPAKLPGSMRKVSGKDSLVLIAMLIQQLWIRQSPRVIARFCSNDGTL
jgi:hypothetical protein